MSWDVLAEKCYCKHYESMPWIPDWEKLPEEVQKQYIAEVQRITKISLQVIVGG